MELHGANCELSLNISRLFLLYLNIFIVERLWPELLRPSFNFFVWFFCKVLAPLSFRLSRRPALGKKASLAEKSTLHKSFPARPLPAAAHSTHPALFSLLYLFFLFWLSVDDVCTLKRVEQSGFSGLMS